MSDYICKWCGNECELEERWIPAEYGDDVMYTVSLCCGVGYYEKEDEL